MLRKQWNEMLCNREENDEMEWAQETKKKEKMCMSCLESHRKNKKQIPIWKVIRRTGCRFNKSDHFIVDVNFQCILLVICHNVHYTLSLIIIRHKMTGESPLPIGSQWIHPSREFPKIKFENTYLSENLLKLSQYKSVPLYTLLYHFHRIIFSWIGSMPNRYIQWNDNPNG